MRDLPGEPALRAELRLHRAQRQRRQCADRAQPEQLQSLLHRRRDRQPRGRAAAPGRRPPHPGGTHATVPAAPVAPRSPPPRVRRLHPSPPGSPCWPPARRRARRAAASLGAAAPGPGPAGQRSRGGRNRRLARPGGLDGHVALQRGEQALRSRGPGRRVERAAHERGAETLRLGQRHATRTPAAAASAETTATRQAPWRGAPSTSGWPASAGSRRHCRRRRKPRHPQRRHPRHRLRLLEEQVRARYVGGAKVPRSARAPPVLVPLSAGEGWRARALGWAQPRTASGPRSRRQRRGPCNLPRRMRHRPRAAVQAARRQPQRQPAERRLRPHRPRRDTPAPRW